MKSFRIYLLLVFSMILLHSCKDDDDNETVQTGKITGQLRLTDEFGTELSDHSGMAITATGANVSSSDSDGSYEIGNLPSATYQLAYEKPGYGTYKRFNIQVLAGSNATVLNGTDYLGQKSSTLITNLSVNYNPADSTYAIGCSIAPLPSAVNQRAFRLFFGKTVSVSSQDYQFTPSNTWIASTGTGTITGYDPSEFYNNGFSSGETVYAIAYGESIRTNTYTDPATNKKVFPNINVNAPSNVVDFVLP